MRTSSEANSPKGLLLNMVHGMENKGHVVVMNNYFTSVELFKNYW